MEGRQLLRVLVLIASVALAAAHLAAQSVNSAQIHGTVTDPTGAAIAGAQIKATQTGMGLVRTTVSGPEGSFSLSNLPVGPYVLDVTFQGFQAFRQTGIILQVSENPKIDVTLKVGTVTQTEEVRADAVMVKTEETSVSQVIDQQRIVDLPLDGRQITDLILLSGGAASTTIPGNDLLSSKNYGNGNVTSSVTATISVAGGQQNANNYLLDGGDHVDKFSNLNMPLPFPDAVQEFSVQTSTLTARYGVHSGSAVNVVTKSGTNAFHGNLFEFIRNDAVNAHHFIFPNFNNPTVPNVPNPNDNGLRRNQLGGTLGGPIVRDKLQFFLGYQATRNFQMPQPSTVFVPTAAALAGDFSFLQTYTDQPGGGCLARPKGAAGPRRQLNTTYFDSSDHIKPSAVVNPAGLQMLALVPVSTDPCGKLVMAIPNTGDEDQGVSRVDLQINSKHTLFGRYFITDFRDGPVFDGQNLLTTTKAGQFARNQSLVLGETYSISPNLLSSFHVTVNRMAIFRGPAANVPNPASFGINVPSPVANDLVISISNYFNVESGTATAGHFNNNSLQLTEDFDWSHGKHQVAFGVNWIHSQLNELSTFQSNGQFTFGGSSTNPSPTGGGATGDGLADFELGLVQNFTQGNNEQENWRQSYYGLYIQDNYRLFRNLTVNAGLRWDPYLPAQDRYNRGGHFDPAAFAAGTRSIVYPGAPPGLFFCGDPQTPCSYVNTHYANFAPRLGFNWDPRGKGKETVRAGFGVFFDNPEEFYFDRFADNSPFGSALTLSRPVGGLTNPYQGLTVPPFPQPFPTAQNAFFPTNGVYINLPLNLRPTYVMQWNLGVEKQIGPDWLFSATYMGNRTNHIWLGYDANSPVFIPGNDCSSSSTVIPKHGTGSSPCSTTGNENVRRPLVLKTGLTGPGALFSSISTATDEGNAAYNGLLLSARHRFSHHYTLLANYTWSHCVDLGEFSGELSSSRLISNPGFFDIDHGNCSFDIRHIFNSSLVVTSAAVGNAFARTLTGNWQLSPIISYRTGNHFSALGGTDASLTGIKQDRADQVGSPFTGTCTDGWSAGSIGCWFNNSAFATNATGTFGTASRNLLTGPGVFTFNLALSRTFKLTERQNLMVRGEAFNVFNHPNFGIPSNSNPSSNGFGQITSQFGSPRVLQLAAKYSF